MIEKEDYIKALQIVKEYENPSNPDLNTVPCYILYRSKDDLTFVTTNEDFANRMYKGGEYIMTVSQLLDVQC